MAEVGEFNYSPLESHKFNHNLMRILLIFLHMYDWFAFDVMVNRETPAYKCLIKC